MSDTRQKAMEEALRFVMADIRLWEMRRKWKSCACTEKHPGDMSVGDLGVAPCWMEEGGELCDGCAIRVELMKDRNSYSKARTLARRKAIYWAKKLATGQPAGVTEASS